MSAQDGAGGAVHGDDDRDRWLLEALRHAPDAGETPPASVRESILAQARRASVPPRERPAPWGRIDAWWSWLARPPVAAGFATIAVSTVLGALWWSGSLQEGADPRTSPPEAAMQAPRPQAKGTPATMAEQPTQTSPPDTGAPQTRVPGRTASPTRPQSAAPGTSQPTAPATSPPFAPATSQPTAPATSQPTAPATSHPTAPATSQEAAPREQPRALRDPRAERRTPSTEDRRDRKAREPLPDASTATPPGPGGHPSPSATMPSELAMETVQAGTPHGTAAPPPPSVPEAADAVAAARRRGEAAPATPAAIEPGLALRPEAAMAQGSATPTPAQASRAELRTSLAAAAPPATARMSLTVDPMAAIAERAASRDDALRWTRDGRRYGHGDAQLAWLDALRSAAAGRWQRAGAGLADGNSVQFLDGARAIAEWRLQDGRVQLIEPAGIWEAPLGDADAARLRALGDAW